MPPVFISWKSPAEERAVGDGAFSYLERGAEILSIGSCAAAGIERRAAFSSPILLDSINRRKSEIGKRPS